MLPQNAGVIHFLHGLTQDDLQEKRDQYLSVGVQDLIDVVNGCILGQKSSQVIFGAENGEDIQKLRDLGISILFYLKLIRVCC